MARFRSLLARLPFDTYLLALIGTVVLAALLPARGAGAIAMEWVVTAAVALLFFLYGARLSPAAVWGGVTHWRLQLLVFLSTFLLFPLIGLAASLVMRPYLPGDLLTGILYLSLLPSTVQSSIAFTAIARGNVPAALCSASVSNLIGVVLTPLLVSLLLPTSGAGFSAQALGDIALQILLPFLLGQIARPWISAWLLEHKALTNVVDRGSVLLVVYAAFSAGMVAGIWTQLSLGDLGMALLLNIVILALVIVLTTVASRRLGFSTQDEIAIVFCGSKKSMASGLPMATILFPGHAVGMIVLPLMLFHQVQLFVCAVLARRYAAREEAIVPPPAAAA